MVLNRVFMTVGWLLLWVMAFASLKSGRAADKRDRIRRQLAQHDGVDRIDHVTEDAFDAAIAQAAIAIVWLRGRIEEEEKEGKDGGRETTKIHENMLQLTAQQLQRHADVQFLRVDVKSDSTLVRNRDALQTNTVFVYNRGLKLPYEGLRAPHVFSSFIERVNSSFVTILEGKSARRDFERVDGPKIVGYFASNSTAFADFHELAKELHPYIPFYVTFDSNIAEKLKLKIHNKEGVVMVHSGEGDTTKLTAPVSLSAILSHIPDQPPIWQHVTQKNLHILWTNPRNAITVLAFSRKQASEAKSFYKTLRSTVKSFRTKINLQIRVIDPDILPTLTDYLQRLFNVDLSEPHLGQVDIIDMAVQWFPMAALKAEKKEAERHRLLQNFFNRLMKLPDEDREEGQDTGDTFKIAAIRVSYALAYSYVAQMILTRVLRPMAQRQA